MARWTQTWMQDLGTSPARAPGEYRGSRIGLPESGRGAVASWGVRMAAFLIDALASALIGRLIDPLPKDLNDTSAQAAIAPLVVLAVVNVIGLALVGQTPGMRLFKLRVRPLVGDPARLGFVPALIRTALLSLFVPAIVFDRDGRGIHDRLSGSVVVHDS
ncbi:MAG: domain containing protein [Blastococcus sp.]|nr:domain containing protein [Blastococcus sp.]